MTVFAKSMRNSKFNDSVDLFATVIKACETLASACRARCTMKGFRCTDHRALAFAPNGTRAWRRYSLIRIPPIDSTHALCRNRLRASPYLQVRWKPTGCFPFASLHLDPLLSVTRTILEILVDRSSIFWFCHRLRYNNNVFFKNEHILFCD